MGLQMRGSNLKKLQEKNEKMQSELLQNEQPQSEPKPTDLPPSEQPQPEQLQPELPSRAQMEEQLANLEAENKLLKRDKETLLTQVDMMEKQILAVVQRMAGQVETVTKAVTEIETANTTLNDNLLGWSDDICNKMYQMAEDATNDAVRQMHSQVKRAIDRHDETVNKMDINANAILKRFQNFFDGMKWKERLFWFSVICNIVLAGGLVYLIYKFVDWSVIIG